MKPNIAMEHGNWFGATDMKVSFVSGAICAILKLLDIYLLTDTYFIVVMKVGLTGVVGGFGGVLGKHLFTYCMAKYKEKFNKKNKRP